MSFFSKPPAKKRPTAKAEAPPRPASPGASVPGASAREVAIEAAGKGTRRPAEPAGDITAAGASLVQWTPGQSSFEVAQTNPGLCAVLENAALRYANAQAKEARELLEEGIANDADTKLSPLAWLALFDLLQRDGDKAAFDRLSLQYVVQFERSAPAWNARANPQAAPRTIAGYIAVTGRLTEASAKQIDGIRRAIANRADAARLDLASVQSFDETGATMLADALAEARRARIGLRIQPGTKLGAALDEALKNGRDGGQGAWLLALELLQWANDRAAFEDRAVDFAVTFELSPPSWEPPAAADKAGTGTAAGNATGDADDVDPDMLHWTGVMTGSLAPQLGKFADSAHDKAVVPVDMSGVERIDFVCAAAFLNVITRIETQRKAVQIYGASPIIRALLLLLGVSPRHFVKKAE
jgi:ABC-type transporter Mla MlaB component